MDVTGAQIRPQRHSIFKRLAHGGEAKAVDGTGAERGERVFMRACAVAFMLGKAVTGKASICRLHKLVPRDLGDDRGRRNIICVYRDSRTGIGDVRCIGGYRSTVGISCVCNISLAVLFERTVAESDEIAELLALLHLFKHLAFPF